MGHPSRLTGSGFDSSARQRVDEYLTRRGMKAEKTRELAPDASMREYFRIPWKRSTAVAAVYPAPFDTEVHPFLDVTRLFSEAGLPVPHILDVDALSGIIVQEDLGDNQLRRLFETVSEDERETYVEQAIALIAKIQAATDRAFEQDSIASRLAFDEAKLSWELDFFYEHYFKSLRHEELKHAEEAELRSELNDIAAELSARPRVLCHRDFHTANLLVDRKGRLRIVDHQDARMGPASYDLVSLLLDRSPRTIAGRNTRAASYFLEERAVTGSMRSIRTNSRVNFA